MIFGSKKEKFIAPNNGQLKLALFDDEPIIDPPPKNTPSKQVTNKENKPKRNHPGRSPLPDHLPVTEIILEPKEDVSNMKHIGQEITYKLCCTPKKFFVEKYIRDIYLEEKGGKSKKVIAELPSFAIPKGIPSEALLSQIMVDKFVDHIPIYRQIVRFNREKININSSTINSWQESVCKLLDPLYEVMKYRVLSQRYLQVDETPIKVLDKKNKGSTHRGYYWVYNSVIGKYIIFDYQKSRSQIGPVELLQDFKGYLQSYGYVVYDQFAKRDGITVLNCMAHARRGFEKALDYDRPNAEYAMTEFQKLYVIERSAKEKNLTPDQRHALRLKESLPILNGLGKWIVEKRKTTLPKSPLGKAINYCVPRWKNLSNYLNDGVLEIDNNLVENSIGPVAIGRKNYLFAGSQNGAKRAAMMYSFYLQEKWGKPLQLA